MSDAETDQMLANIRSVDDLEDFMVYYEFSEAEKAEVRREWQEKQVQDRGIGTFILAGVGAFCGYQVLKRLTHKNKNKPGKKPWTPGAGGTKPSWAPAAIGAGLGGLGGYAAGQHFGGHPQQAPPQQGYGAPPQGAYNYPPQQFNQPHRDASQTQQQYAPPAAQYASSFVPPGQQYPSQPFAAPAQPFAPPSQPYGQPPQQYQPFAPPGGAYYGAPAPQPFAPGPYPQGGQPNAFAPMGGSLR